MKRYLFLGATRTGKSTIILTLAKIFSSLNKNVLVVDSTRGQTLKSFFNYNDLVEPKNPLIENKPIVRENFEVIFTDEEKFIADNFKIDTSKYDYIFVESDGKVELFNEYETTFLIQDMDLTSLEYSKSISVNIKDDTQKIVLILNKVIDDVDISYFFGELATYLGYNKIDKSEDIEFVYTEKDYINIISGKFDGKIDMKYFSDEFKAAMFELVNKIESVDFKSYRKIMK